MGARRTEGLVNDIPRRPEKASALSRLGWNIVGTVSLMLGIIGIFLPVLPTTPFVLAAAGCYLRGSKKMYDAMISNRLFGRIIHDYLTGRGVPRRVKVASISILWCSLTASYVVFQLPEWMIPVFILVGIGVSTHVIMLSPRKA